MTRSVAYADPPYPGQSKRHYGAHPDFAGEVDHAELVSRLVRDYPDGWALCEANGWTRIRAEHPDGYALIYRAGDGLEFVDGDERAAFYPEAELDDERWAPAAWTPEANSAS